MRIMLIMGKVMTLIVVMVQTPVMEPVITKATTPAKATVKTTVTETVIMELIITNLALPRRILTTQDSNPVTLEDMDMVAVAVVVVVVVVVATAMDKDILNHLRMRYSCRHYSVDRNVTSMHFRNSTPKLNGMSFNSRPKRSSCTRCRTRF